MQGRDGRTIALEQHTDTFSCKNARMHLNKAGYTAQHKLRGLGRGIKAKKVRPEKIIAEKIIARALDGQQFLLPLCSCL